MTEQDPARYDVFISYSLAEGDWVREGLLPELESAGLKVLIDSRDFEIGVPNVVNLERAVDNSEFTLVVVSPDWLDNEWSEFEGLLTTAADPAGRKRKLMPLIYAPCAELPRRIAMLTCLDLTEPENRAEQMERLLRGLGADPDRARIAAHRARFHQLQARCRARRAGCA